MPPKPPSLYDLKKTTIFFSLASIFLLIGLVAMVMQDSTREWKKYQRHFMEYMRESAERELEAAEKSLDQKKIGEIKNQRESAKVELSQHQSELETAKAELGEIEIETNVAKTRFQDLKQEQESDRYFLEENRAHHHTEKAEKYAKQVAAREPKLRQAKNDYDDIQAARDQKLAQIAQFNGKLTALQKEEEAIFKSQLLLERKIAKLKPDWIKAILNAPMLDFIRPTLQIQQIVVEHLYDDFYFNKAQKVDRCITCHLGIDQKGLENAPAPFKSHPRLDLFLSSDSPHPMEEFGCTICHGGSGQSVSFTTAAHTPASPEQAKQWEKEHHWHPMKHWSEKMLPLNHAEAACAKCHTGTVEVPQAPKLNEGRHLAETFGCFGCHKTEGFSRWKAGPGLEHVQSKLEQDWIVRWLQNPKEFRPSTKMPRVFHLSNTSDPASIEKNNVAIAGIASYLIKNSDPVKLESPPAGGDVKEGERLVNEAGCLGCHSTGSITANNHGPELSGLGSKVKSDWLFTWLKDPKHYYEKTRMPNLRLSDKEASDIAAYLLSQKNEKFESIQPPLVKPEAVEEMTMNYMAGTMRLEEAKAELGKLNMEQRLEFIGKKAIAHQGCFGCHDIKGFADAKPIGTELTIEGSKEVEKFYFGFVDIEHTRQAWFFQKLKEPRIFDKGKELSYLEKLRMPNFEFTDKEAESLVTFLLSLQKAEIPLEMKKQLSEKEVEVEAGRLLVTKMNCNGCHTLDGKEGRARQLFEDKGNAPPVIDGEGSKVQSEWLYNFLHSPTTIRPWLKYRMPTFGFDEKQLTALVQYFNHLDKVAPSFTGEKIPPPSAEELSDGKKLFQAFQCIKCHKSNPEPGLSASFLAPDLVPAKNRLRPGWVIDWIRDPQVIQPGTMMPAFFPDGQSPMQDVLGGDAGKQIKAMRDYLWNFTPDEAAAVTTASKPAQAK